MIDSVVSEIGISGVFCVLKFFKAGNGLTIYLPSF